MIKTLTPIGNSLGIIIDRPILELLKIDRETPLEITTDGKGFYVRPIPFADEVEILPYTVIATSRVDRRASIGPFARLRMTNEVGEGAHIGNFVELKKTRLHAGVKAGHLAYLGDSDIGADVNIGAGTITCNYDGFKKHPTKIGPGAFIGSNSTLVAPIDIGEGAYIGAGSVITDPVPEQALGLGRSRQVVKEKWAEKRRAAKKG